jgi:hypothetical protein
VTRPWNAQQRSTEGCRIWWDMRGPQKWIEMDGLCHGKSMENPSDSICKRDANHGALVIKIDGCACSFWNSQEPDSCVLLGMFNTEIWGWAWWMPQHQMDNIIPEQVQQCSKEANINKMTSPRSTNSLANHMNEGLYKLYILTYGGLTPRVIPIKYKHMLHILKYDKIPWRHHPNCTLKIPALEQ